MVKKSYHRLFLKGGGLADRYLGQDHYFCKRFRTLRIFWDRKNWSLLMGSRHSLYRKPNIFSSEAFEGKKLNKKLTGNLFALSYDWKRCLYFFMVSIRFCGWYESWENCTWAETLNKLDCKTCAVIPDFDKYISKYTLPTRNFKFYTSIVPVQTICVGWSVLNSVEPFNSMLKKPSNV